MVVDTQKNLFTDFVDTRVRALFDDRGVPTRATTRSSATAAGSTAPVRRPRCAPSASATGTSSPSPGRPRRHGLPTGDRRRGQVGASRHDRHPHPLRRRGARRTGAVRIAAPRRHHRDARDPARCRPSTSTGSMPATSSAASRRSPANTSSPQWISTRPGPTARSTSRRSEARPLGPNVAAFIGHSDMRAVDDGSGPRHPQGRASDAKRAGPDGAHAHRGAARRLRRNVVHAAAFRQARRRDLPVAHAAVDLCQTA